MRHQFRPEGRGQRKCQSGLESHHHASSKRPESSTGSVGVIEVSLLDYIWLCCACPLPRDMLDATMNDWLPASIVAF